jgi:hypothetical protein
MGTTGYGKDLLSEGIKVEKRPNETVASFPRYDPIIMPAHHLLLQQIVTKPLPTSPNPSTDTKAKKEVA